MLVGIIYSTSGFTERKFKYQDKTTVDVRRLMKHLGFKHQLHKNLKKREELEAILKVLIIMIKMYFSAWLFCLKETIQIMIISHGANSVFLLEDSSLSNKPNSRVSSK